MVVCFTGALNKRPKRSPLYDGATVYERDHVDLLTALVKNAVIAGKSAVSHITYHHSPAQPLSGIAGRDEFLPDVSAIAQFQQRSHDVGVVDLLIQVEFASTRIASRVDMTDQIAVLIDTPN